MRPCIDILKLPSEDRSRNPFFWHRLMNIIHMAHKSSLGSSSCCHYGIAEYAHKCAIVLPGFHCLWYLRNNWIRDWFSGIWNFLFHLKVKVFIAFLCLQSIFLSRNRTEAREPLLIENVLVIELACHAHFWHFSSSAKMIFLCPKFFIVAKHNFSVTMDPLTFQSELVLTKTYQTEATDSFNDWKLLQYELVRRAFFSSCFSLLSKTTFLSL